MSAGVATRPKVFAVPFRETLRWDPLSFHRISWHWRVGAMVPIAEMLLPRKEKVDRAENDFTDLMPITIHFDGSVEPRSVDASREYTMALYWARPGDIVVSKIDLKNGAVAIIPDGWGNAVVTSHFAVYRPDTNRMIPEYFHLLIQARFFRDYLWQNKVGAEGRKEVKLDFFESIEIPLPPLPVQQAIVRHWQETRERVAEATDKLAAIREALHEEMVSRTHGYDQVCRSRVLVASFCKAPQWDTKGGRAAAFMQANPDFVRLGDFTEECTDLVQPWEQESKEWPVYGVNNSDGVFLSQTQKGADFNAAYKHIEQDCFFHNPTRANVGSLGIVPEVPPDAITSPEYQVWRLTSGFIPGFMETLIQTDYFLSLVAFNRVGGVKQRMYYANFAEIRLPMIPEEIQHSFASQRRTALDDLTVARHELTRRKREVEEMILGVRPVEGV